MSEWGWLSPIILSQKLIMLPCHLWNVGTHEKAYSVVAPSLWNLLCTELSTIADGFYPLLMGF